jgi:DNA repair protein RecO (recombination protein O)
VGLISCNSFVLGTHALKETDRIVSLLTREHGKKRGVAKGARRPRSGFSGTLEPMTEAHVVYFEKEGRELVSINTIDPIRGSFPLSDDLERALLLPALCESLEIFVPDSDPSEPFYRLARHTMDSLFAGAPASLASAYFDVWILKLSGLFPTTRQCAVCERPLEGEGPLLFDQSLPGFIGPECRRGEVQRLTPEAHQTLHGFLANPLDPAARPAGVNEIAVVARLCRRHFLGHELKSQRVLEEVLG